MLQLHVKETDLFNNDTQEFIKVKPITLQLEHSLVSISKWEAKWHKPFLTDDPKTDEEIKDYLRCMTLTQNVPEDTYLAITDKQIKQIRDYIADPMTATTFREEPTKGRVKKQILTNEVIYYQMIALGIPIEVCQKWHLHRLLTLIRVCNIKSQPEKKMKSGDLARQYSSLNNARRSALHTKG